VSQFLLQVLSRSFAPLPPSLDFSSFFPHPGRGIFPSSPGFTTHACFLKRCAQCCWVNILSTNPFCGLLHSHRQGISRFPQIGVVFLIFKKIVPPNRKHKIFCTPSLSFEMRAKKPHASQIGCRVALFRIHWACLTTVECPCLGLYAREMPGFLSPLLLLLLPFTTFGELNSCELGVFRF